MLLLRPLVSVVVKLWHCLVATLRLLLPGRGKARQTSPEPQKAWGGGRGEEEWDNWDSMEPFSVHVVPVDGEPHPPTTSPGANQSDEAPEVDLFQDMQPVIKKAKKVHTHVAMEIALHDKLGHRYFYVYLIHNLYMSKCDSTHVPCLRSFI